MYVCTCTVWLCIDLQTCRTCTLWMGWMGWDVQCRVLVRILMKFICIFKLHCKCESFEINWKKDRSPKRVAKSPVIKCAIVMLPGNQPTNQSKSTVAACPCIQPNKYKNPDWDWHSSYTPSVWHHDKWNCGTFSVTNVATWWYWPLCPWQTWQSNNHIPCQNMAKSSKSVWRS